ncbi:hypothetical protein M0534_03530 [Methylonatrum kenyense]|uniref:ABC transporter substrate-binding protein n=1 Tax=Methylonatrum kenyense TaxID=455253 RepID=UPI0020BFAEEE|nr:hypothetical protein [Methylonatrum kenyense]MCK8515407.1 hypothetical protein [Methylonatrum kenyense]
MNRTRYAAPLLAGLIGMGLVSASVADEIVSIAFIGEDGSDAYKGAEMGLEEINRAGGFLGYEFSLDVVASHDDIADDAIAVVVTSDGDDAGSVADGFPALAVFNTGSDDDALREACRDNLFSIMPSASMRQDALEQWHQQADDHDIAAVAHHHAFRRYSSGDLNGRFVEAYDEPMTERAWTAFVALRMVGDGVTRTASREADTLIQHLKDLESFDASKGQPLSFRENGQLRQPLWIVQDDSVIGEAPVDGVVDPDDLDTLGNISCAD